MTRAAAAALLSAALAVSGCATSGQSPAPPPAADEGPDLATPQASLSAQIAATAALVGDALSRAGFRYDQARVPYRPSEPPELNSLPRGVFQVDLPDPDDGRFVIYEFLDPAAAANGGRAFAGYLGSPFGQTNYPLDAQFSLAQVGGTLVFTWWSSDRSSARPQARAAFEAIASVGQPITILK